MSFRLEVNYERAVEVYGRLLPAYLTGTSFYEDASLPQRFENLPTNMSSELDHSRLLFFVNEFMQGGVVTEHAFQAFQMLHEDRPELFIPEDVINISEGRIREEIKRVGLGLFNTRPKWRKHNAQILLEYWGGDPRNVFVDLPDDPRDAWDELQARTVFRPGNPYPGFIGTQEKIAAMFGTFMVDANLVQNRQLAIPVDSHLIRMHVASEIVTSSKREVGSWKEINALRDAIRDVGLRYCLENGKPSTLLSEALWTYSQLACRYAPGNRTKEGLYAARSTPITYIGFRKSHPSDYLAYQRTCARCLIGDLCKWNVPTRYYYRWGQVYIFPRYVPDELIGREKEGLKESSATRCDKHRRIWSGAPGTCIGCGACDEGRKKSGEMSVSRRRALAVAREVKTRTSGGLVLFD